MTTNHHIKNLCPPASIRVIALALSIVLLVTPVLARAALLEDANGDGEVNVVDVLRIVLTSRQGVYRPQQDYNQDGTVSLADATELTKALMAGTRTLCARDTGRAATDINRWCNVHDG